MGVSELSAWVSLIAALLSISYVAVDYWQGAEQRDRAGQKDPASLGSLSAGPSPAGFIDEHGSLLVAVVSLGFVALLADFTVSAVTNASTAAVWVGFGLLAVVLVVADLSDDLPDPEG